MCNGPSRTSTIPGKRQLSPTLEAVSSFLGSAPSSDEAPNGSTTDVDLVDCAAKALLCNLNRDSVSRQSSSEGLGEDSFDQRFDSAAVPQIPLRTYLQRLYRAFRCSDASFVCALVLLDRVLDNAGCFRLTPRNVHRLFFSCAVLATKYNEDRTWCNWDFARIGGIDLEDLNEYEMVLFSKLGYKLAVNCEEFEFYRAFLVALADPSLALPADFSSGGGAGGGRAAFVCAGEKGMGPLSAARITEVPPAATFQPVAACSQEVCCASALAGLIRWLQPQRAAAERKASSASGPWRVRR